MKILFFFENELLERKNSLFFVNLLTLLTFPIVSIVETIGKAKKISKFTKNNRFQVQGARSGRKNNIFQKILFLS